MRQHLVDDPDAQPAALEATEAGWLRLSSRLTREIGRLADRDDLIVQAAPGAGRGSPGCFVPALATIEVDGRLLPAGVDPARARPRRPGDRERYPVLWGVLSHEAGHARHTRWQPPSDASAATVAAAKLLEEPRAEACQLGRRPGDRRWLRASATELVLEGEVSDEAVTPWAAAQAAALVLGRVDGGVLDPDEAAPLTAAVEATLGKARLAALREVWQAALEVADDDGDAMLELGRRWCELVDIDPDGPDPDGPGSDSDTGAGGAAGQPAPDQGAASSDPSGRTEAGRSRSPIAEATRAVLAAVAANDAAEAAAEAAASAAAAGRAAAKAREAASRRHTEDAAATVFAPHTHEGISGPGSRATWTTRPPTPAERAAARRLARQLRATSHRDRATTHVTSKAPPGRLQVRAALAADAQRAAGLRPTAEPWLRTVHRHVPSPPLKVGIAVDVSGSMQPFAKPLASAAWIIAQAAGWSDATAATVCFGEQVTAVTRPGQVPAHVREFSADHGTEVFCQAVDALDGALGLSRAGDGARLLVVVSDGYYTAAQRTGGQIRVRRLLACGCGVLWIALRKDPKPMDGAQVALLDDPSAAGEVIGIAAKRALRAAP
jgi:hypothetical protein